MSRINELKAQIAQLDALIADGTLSGEAARETRQRLEQELLAQVVLPAAMPPAVTTAGSASPAPAAVAASGATAVAPSAVAPVTARPSRGLVAGVVGFVLAFGVAGYALVGNRQGWSVGPGSAAAAASAPVTAEQIEGMLAKLVERLKQQPDDAEGWAMLGRSYSVMGRFEEAVPAFRKVVELRPKEAQGFADLADALASAKGGTMEGEPTQLIAQALALEPKNLKGLALSGSIAFNRGDMAGAIRWWEQALAEAQPEGDMARQLQAVIEETRKRMAAVAGGSGAAASGPAATAPQASASPPAAASAGAQVQGRVTLSAALKAKADPQDTLYVFARAAQGAKVPLAILRKQVKDLPLDFALDDSLAMSPAAKLSGATEVVIGARISKSGNALPQPGDLQGFSTPVPVGTRGVVVEIGEAVR